MKQKDLVMIFVLLSINTSLGLADLYGATVTNPTSSSSQNPMVQGTNADTEKQITVIDVGGNLKIVAPNQSGPSSPVQSNTESSIPNQYAPSMPGQAGQVTVTPKPPTKVPGLPNQLPLPSGQTTVGNIQDQATPAIVNQQGSPVPGSMPIIPQSGVLPSQPNQATIPAQTPGEQNMPSPAPMPTPEGQGAAPMPPSPIQLPNGQQGPLPMPNQQTNFPSPGGTPLTNTQKHSMLMPPMPKSGFSS